MLVDQFNFDLPDDLIALRPTLPRDAARMMVVFTDGHIVHSHVRDLPQFLRPGDALVVNDSRVIAARLRGVRLARPGGTDAKIELLLHRRLARGHFSALARPARKLRVCDRLVLGAMKAWVVACGAAGEIEVAFEGPDNQLEAAIEANGEIPLPPYIAGRRKADAKDVSDYQTMFARLPGSVAAPTAGLHFTPNLLGAVAACGIVIESLTLHVGLGTFQTVSVEDTGSHRLHAELAILPAEAAARLNNARALGGRIAAVGTTSIRVLESAAAADGGLSAFDGETDIFITPGYCFRTAEILMTNFHLPRSTLFMLVCAFAGLETMRAAYREAIAERYRFYSYGDACLLLRSPNG